ncbi:MAG: HAMP domain-containing sensor histidine kinase [Actinomycetota bacterium]|nr:HAMP domain-containing sensor histidine kinase [Actinomycetota bacterium]
MNWRAFSAIGVLGLAAAFVVSYAVETPMEQDSLRLVGTAFVAAAITGLAGWALLVGLRTLPVYAQTVVVALVSVAGTAVGVWATASSMFLSTHDLDVLLVVLVASGTVSVLAALALGDRVGRAGRALEALSRSIGDDADGDADGVVDDGEVPATRELARVAAQLRETSARLEASRARERALDASRRELVAWVSHDLRTPLAGIRAMAEALEDGVVDDPDAVARYHRNMRTESDRLAGLVEDLFELSRIHAGALTLRPVAIGVDELVSDALAAASVGADAAGVRLEGRVVGPPVTVRVSVRELGRVLANLVDNAIRHTPAGGEVCVEATTEPDGAAGDGGSGGAGAVVLRVSDTGVGIPADELDRVFDLGYTGDAARTPRGRGGSGLGLAIAQGLVAAHGGSIEVEQAPGGGACFAVRLPPSLLVRPGDTNDADGAGLGAALEQGATPPGR